MVTKLYTLFDNKFYFYYLIRGEQCIFIFDKCILTDIETARISWSVNVEHGFKRKFLSKKAICDLIIFYDNKLRTIQEVIRMKEWH